MIIEHFLEWMHSAPVPERAQAVNALARAYLFSNMSEEDRITAESAMTVLLEDSSSHVRFALADALASAPNTPRHIVMALARDTVEISTMVLSRSPVFSDTELVDLVAAGSVEQQIAIACRGNLSRAICGAISEVGVVEACLGLLSNQAACLSKRIQMRIAERHGTDAQIRKTMLAIENLDADIRMMLIDKLGYTLGEFVSGNNWLSRSRAKKSIKDTLERSSILRAAVADESQLAMIVSALIQSKRMTTSYLLRAICMGNITLFCAALSQLSKIPANRIEAMISQNRQSAFRAAFIKSGMPLEAFEVFSTALSVWKNLLSQPEWVSRARLPYLVTRKLVERYQGHNDKVVDELLLLLQQISADMAREEARSHVSQLAQKRALQREKELSENLSRILEVDLKAAVETNIHPAEISNTLVDEQFALDMENSIAEALEKDIIEISDNDMRLPERADNDSPINKDMAETVPILESSLMAKAA